MQASHRISVLSSAVAACAVISAANPAQAAPAAYQTAVTTGTTPYVYYRQAEPSGPTATATVGTNGTYNGTPTFSQTGVGLGSDSAVSYDGVNDSNEMLSANINSFGSLLATSSYEFVFKVNPGAATTQQSLFGIFSAAANLPDVEVTLNSNGNDSGGNVPGNTRLFIRGNNADANGGASIAAHFTNASMYDGNYHHLVMTYDDAGTGAGAFTAYVDGIAQTMVFTQVNGTVEPVGFSDFDVPATFAARNVRSTTLAVTGGSSVGREANVTLDEVALYGGVLGASEVEAHATAAGFVVPEPGSLALAGIAGLGLLARRRRQA